MAIQLQFEVQKQQDPSAAEFFIHPDFHQICSFFLGWVFLSSLHHLCCSPFAHYIVSRLTVVIFRSLGSRKVLNVGTLALEAPYPAPVAEKARWWADEVASEVIFPKNGSPALVFTLTLLFALASLAQFASLLSFSPTSSLSESTCAFVVAWGGMSSQSARLVGLLILGLELRSLGVGFWESVTLSVSLVVATVLVFVTNSIGIGVLSIAPEPINIALCYRKHFLPTSLTSSLVAIVLELYCLIRLLYRIVPPFLQRRHKLDAVKDIRIARVTSLLALDIMTVIPNCMESSILAEFIPSSIGALLVLILFNHRSSGCRRCEIPVTTLPSVHPPSYFNRQIPILRSPRQPDRPQPLHITVGSPRGHPFSANALLDPAIQAEEWPVSGVTETDSDSVSQSIRGAVLQTAVRQNLRSAVPIPPVPPVPASLSAQLSKFKLLPILPNQAQVAHEFEREDQAAVAAVRRESRMRHLRPKISLTVRTSASTSRASSAVLESPVAHSVYGSDIIRSTSDRRLADKLRRTVRGANRSSRLTFISMRGTDSSASSVRSLRRHSDASTSAAVPAVPQSYLQRDPSMRQGDLTGQDDVRRKRPTFGEDMFAQAGLSLTSPTAPTFAVNAGLPSSPRVKGPRPPPLSVRRQDTV